MSYKHLLWFFFSVSGRINRSQYILGCALNVVVLVAIFALVGALGADEALGLLMLPLGGVLFWSNLALGLKRWQDLGFSRAAFFLIPFIPLAGSLIFILCCFRAGEVGDNKYGPPPKPLMDAMRRRPRRGGGVKPGVIAISSALLATPLALLGWVWGFEYDLPVMVGAGCFALSLGFLWGATSLSAAAQRDGRKLRAGEWFGALWWWCLAVIGAHLILDAHVERVVGGCGVILVSVLALALSKRRAQLKLAGPLFPRWMWGALGLMWLMVFTVTCILLGVPRAAALVAVGGGFAAFALVTTSWRLGEQQARVDVCRPPPCGLDFEAVERLIMGDGLRLYVAQPQLRSHGSPLMVSGRAELELKRPDPQTPQTWSLSCRVEGAEVRSLGVFEVHPQSEALLVWALCRLCVHEGWVLRSPWGSFRKEDQGRCGLREAVQMASDHRLARVEDDGAPECLVEDRWPQRVTYAFDESGEARRGFEQLRERLQRATWAAILGVWTLPLAPLIHRRLKALPDAPSLSLDAEGIATGRLRCAWDEVLWVTALPIHSGPVLVVTARGAMALPVSEVYEARLRFGRHLMKRVGGWLHDPELEPEPPRITPTGLRRGARAPSRWRLASRAWTLLSVSMVGVGALMMGYFWWVWWALSHADLTPGQAFFPLELISGASVSRRGLGGMPFVGVGLMVVGNVGLMLSPSQASSRAWTPLRAVALTVAQLASLAVLTMPGYGAPLTGHFLGPYRLSNVVLENEDLSAVRWDPQVVEGARSKITGSNLNGAVLGGADLGWGVFDKSSFKGANLVNAMLVESSFVKARLDGAALNWAELRRADLTRASLRKSNLWRADLSGADLGRADLRGANFSGANFSGADLRKADLRGANLSGANLSGADLRGAKMKGARFDRAILRDARCLKDDARCQKIVGD